MYRKINNLQIMCADPHNCYSHEFIFNGLRGEVLFSAYKFTYTVNYNNKTADFKPSIKFEKDIFFTNEYKEDLRKCLRSMSE